jgi:ribosomal protein L6P/L9E
MIICSGIKVKNVGFLAASVRKMKAQTKDGHYKD